MHFQVAMFSLCGCSQSWPIEPYFLSRIRKSKDMVGDASYLLTIAVSTFVAGIYPNPISSIQFGRVSRIRDEQLPRIICWHTAVSQRWQSLGLSSLLHVRNSLIIEDLFWNGRQSRWLIAMFAKRNPTTEKSSFESGLTKGSRDRTLEQLDSERARSFYFLFHQIHQ